jgi:hypothetical protein
VLNDVEGFRRRVEKENAIEARAPAIRNYLRVVLPIFSLAIILLAAATYFAMHG